nr:ribonuclease H-like domain-containing protein [Tanacetum cinerariifolium]
MKMEYWIMNTDHNLWKVIQNENSKKSIGRDSKRGIIILPPVSFEEHVAVQRETKARTLLLQSLPEDHMADFHYLDNARVIWLAVKDRFGGNEESKKMRKTMLKQAFLEFSVSEEEGLHKGYDRSIPAASRHNPASIYAGKHIPAGRINKPAPFPAGSSVPTGWTNPAARPFFKPTNLYFDNHVVLGDITDLICNGVPRTKVHPHVNKDIDIVDSGCSRIMTGNKEKLDEFMQVKGDTVPFGGDGGDGKITGRGTIRTSKLDFENVYYVEELQNFSLFSVSQICDKKNKVLFTDFECLVLTKEFQLPDESQVVLRILRRHYLYTFNLSDIQPKQHTNCLLAKASLEESTKWHIRMAHVNFKTINKLAKHGLVEGLPLKLFTNEHNCVACNKGKSIDHKYYSLVVTDDFSRFCWAFFMGTKDETFYILKDFIALIENKLNKKVKAIRCDNGIEFQNANLIALYGEKGIKRDYSNARTPQQNGVAERKNRTLIEAVMY